MRECRLAGVPRLRIGLVSTGPGRARRAGADSRGAAQRTGRHGIGEERTGSPMDSLRPKRGRRSEAALNSAEGVAPRCTRRQLVSGQARRPSWPGHFPRSVVPIFPGRVPMRRTHVPGGETAGALPDRCLPNRPPHPRREIGFPSRRYCSPRRRDSATGPKPASQSAAGASPSGPAPARAMTSGGLAMIYRHGAGHSTTSAVRKEE